MPAVLIPAAATLGAAYLGSKSSKDAANAQAASTAEAIAEQRRQYDLTREDFAPWRQAGQDALVSLQTDINRLPTAAEVMSDPGYQFGLDQGQQAINRRIAAMGGRVSGNAIKAASRFGTDYATTGYNAAYQRRQDRLNRLAALAGIGQTATGASAMSGANASNAISGLLSSQGDAYAASKLQRGNIWGNAGNQLAALYRPQPQTDNSGGIWAPGYGSGDDGSWTGDH